ncbi:1678_t:CDS:2, partial [Cetraspora pellucida]
TLNINNKTSDTSDIEWKEPNKNHEDIDILLFVAFLEEVKLDYQNASELLCAALDKFKEHYNVSKSKSISQLSSYLYDLNHNIDLMARVKKKENTDPQTIPARKKKKIGKK